MKFDTGISLCVGCLLYFALLAIFFVITPPELFLGTNISGLQLNTNTTIETTATSNAVSTFSVFSQFATFRLDGIPFFATVLFVYVPTVLLGIGIYGLIRGI